MVVAVVVTPASGAGDRLRLTLAEPGPRPDPGAAWVGTATGSLAQFVAVSLCLVVESQADPAGDPGKCHQRLVRYMPPRQRQINFEVPTLVLACRCAWA